jgi:FtsH-binding integral membrane protein
MSDFGNYSATGSRTDAATDPGLKKFMLGVYQKVAIGLLVSAALAWLTGSYAPIRDLMFVVSPTGGLRGFTLLGMIVSYAPLAILLFSAFALRNASPRAANLLYWVIVALIGASMGTLVLLYTGVSIVTTFLITASAFGALSLFGYTTKMNLGPVRSFLVIAAWGLLATILVGAIGGAMGWFATGTLFLVVNAVGVLIFAGLIAADTQHLKMTYYALNGDEVGMNVATSVGALNLYLDFINLFRFLLYFLGVRRD